MFGERLKQSRKRAGLTQGELADGMGGRYDRSMISHVESGRVNFLTNGLAKAALALNVSTDYLLGLSDDPTPAAELFKMSPCSELPLPDNDGSSDILEIPQKEGILPARLLRAAAQEGLFTSDYTIPEENYQPASLDLRLGETAHILQCSFLPHGRTVEDKLSELSIGEIDIRDGAILERNRPYLIPLLERIDLPQGISARANPKSSTGRLDIFTRVLTDGGHEFDDIAQGYQGKMYLEVFSRAFTIKVRTRLSLNQIRLFKGDPRCAPGQLRDTHQDSPIILPSPEEAGYLAGPNTDNSVGLTINLRDERGIGYRAKKNSTLLDLSRTDWYEAGDFWERVYPGRNNCLILEPEEFYLLAAAEAISIPPEYAAEMKAYESSSGELRTHYAGFFDPGFGYGEDGRLGGVQPVLEVRAHDVPFMIAPGQKVCTLTFEKMLETPEHWYGAKMGSSYQKAGRTLSKHFH